MPMFDKRCNKCEKIRLDVWESARKDSDPCECGGEWERVYLPSQHRAVIGDEIDVWVKNALCNSDGTPRRYRSRQELRREEQRRGYTNYVTHIGAKGSDKSKHTTRWT